VAIAAHVELLEQVQVPASEMQQFKFLVPSVAGHTWTCDVGQF
jgi:hypothetical protein